MMTYIGCGERVREKEKGVGVGERFLLHIKVFTWLCMCLLSGRQGEEKRKARGGQITLGWKRK